MPPATAAYYDTAATPDAALQLFEKIHMSGICCCSAIPGHGVFEAPLILFSPGFGTSRLVYSILAEYLSSWGYTVVTVDHTYDSNIVEFPDGTVVEGIFNNGFSLDDITASLAVRVDDMHFLTKKLSRPGAKVGVYGHSLGGDTAATVMSQDKQDIYPGGINFDGDFYGAAATDGLGKGRKAFLIWTAMSHNDTTDPTLTQWWNATSTLTPRDPRWQLQIADSLHFTFSDLPLLADISGARAAFPDFINAELGTINGVKSTEIILAYVKAVFDLSLKGLPQPLLRKATSPYPEVDVQKKEAY
jgi:dienelactone hydrolase